MIKIVFTEPQSLEWQNWKMEATRSAAALWVDYQANRAIRISIDEKLYRQRKSDIVAACRNKCVYCEQVIVGLSQPGDIEHFRPKKAVLEDNGRGARRVVNGLNETHPGYFWLAYEWNNLLLACKTCNSRGTNAEGKVVGKGNYFPIAGTRGWEPGEEANEMPLLLNPLVDDPEKHFIIDGTGILTGVTERGKKCVELLDLNRDALVDARRRIYEAVVFIVDKIWSEVKVGALDRLLVHLHELKTYREGAKPHTFAARAASKSLSTTLERISKELDSPLTPDIEQSYPR
jgi:hypothetical protein